MMHNPPFLVLIFFFSTLLIQYVAAAAAAKPTTSGFSIDLIHRDSQLSPFYNSSLTSSQILRKNALHSKHRIKNIQSLIDQKSNIQSVVTPNGGSYLMKLSFGTPPVEYYAVADTGSDLIWIQCAPCQCYDQGSSPFNPQASSTYQTLSCETDACGFLPRAECSDTNDCKYLYSYGDKSFTIGILSTDTLSFDTSDGRKAGFPTSTFGCGYNNQGKFRSPGAGLVGLGGGPLSLISQLGDQIDERFSYCLVRRSAQTSGKLNFGQEAIISQPGAVSTPLKTDNNRPTFYYLSLEGVSIGDKTAQADSGSIIIDSGTTLTILESNFYYNLENMVKEAIGADSVPDPSDTFSLCFDADTNINVPEMVFHFDGADLRLQPYNTFILVDDLVCMLIVPNDDDSLSIFGNFAQINFLVEYDLQKHTVTFAPTDCSKQ